VLVRQVAGRIDQPNDSQEFFPIAGPDIHSTADTAASRAEFITRNLRLSPVPLVAEIRLYTAHPASGLHQIDNCDHTPPYWAYPWSGGMALARHMLDNPGLVTGRAVLDLGSGSGLVGIAAALAGASHVVAAEIDPFGCAAIPLNAAENRVGITVVDDDLLDGPPPDAEVIAVGDLFYNRKLARRVTGFLDRCVDAGMDVLVGDPHRAFLPLKRLAPLASYDVPDMGLVAGPKAGAVFRFGR